MNFDRQIKKIKIIFINQLIVRVWLIGALLYFP